jgi:peroxisomal enoyl-CoA hydratase 2
VNFNQRFKSTNNVRGLPPFDSKRVVHASQSIEVLKPIPLVSGPGWKLKKRLAAIRENSAFAPFPVFTATLTECAESGVIIESEYTLVDPNNTPYSRLFVRFLLLPRLPSSAALT